MEINYKQLAILSLVFVILFSLYKGCTDKKYDKLKSEFSLVQLDNQKLDSIRNEQGKTIYTQQVVILENQKVLNDYTDSIFDLKRKHERKVKDVIAYYKNTTLTRVDSFWVYEVDSIPYPIYITDNFVRDSMITVPRTYKVENPYFNFNGTVKKDGLMINSLSLPDTIQGRFVTRKGGFLKSETIEYQYFNTNPYVKQQNANSVTYKEKGKFWRKVKEAAIYMGIGFLIHSSL
jgi:hypothetical protein